MTRLGYVTATAFATLLVATVSFVPMPVKLTWNASASTPIGLYDLAPPRDLKVGDLVAIMPPAPLADFMVGRSYIGRDVPLLKHVAALPGQRVCRFGPRVTIDGVLLAGALAPRQSRPRPTGLAGLPAHRQRPALPHECVGPRQLRRSLFRRAPDAQRHRRGDADLHRPGQ